MSPIDPQRRVAAPPDKLVRLLLDWYRVNQRELPWRGETDPYRIWISEVMLQQTRVEAVRPYYESFLARYPSVSDLAAAPLQEVLASWAGLGYYRRARMLHQAARRVADENGGIWPSDHASLLRLPGIGDYTAAAIASIAFDEPRAALDGNAFRVLARLADERRDIRGSHPKRALKALGQDLAQATPPGERGQFTQALMELGATVCVPRAPRCAACPWAVSCAALAAGTASELPVKERRAAIRSVEVSVAVARRSGRILVRRRRPEDSIMPGFWELPFAEGAVLSVAGLDMFDSATAVRIGSFSHAITVTDYTCHVYEAKALAREDPGTGYRWMSAEELRSVPITTISRKALRIAGDL